MHSPEDQSFAAASSVQLFEGKIDHPRWGPDLSSKKAILDLLVVILIMSTAYVSHFNVQPIYNELEGRSPEKMNLVGMITTGLCVFLYASTTISGYLLFGKDTESDVSCIYSLGFLTENKKRCLALNVVLLLILYMGSTMIPNIETAFKFTGATTNVRLRFKRELIQINAYTCSYYTCPICSKSLGDMQDYFGMLDAFLAEEEIPNEHGGQTHRP